MSTKILTRLRIWGSMPGEGINTQGHVLVNKTADGVDLNLIWAEIEQLLEAWNGERTTVASLISYPTTVPADAVPQTLTVEPFDVASEFGIPKGVAPPPDYLKVGYSFVDYDKSARYTWRFVRDATAEQVRSVVTRILSGDNQLVNGLVLRRLFDPAEGVNEFQHRVFGLWNGTDGIAPPAHMGVSFPASTSHYIASGAAVIDSGDIEDCIRMITLKGYGLRVGSQLLILANPAESELIQGWRAGKESRTGGPTAKYDFIRSSNAPAYLSSENVVGAIPPPDYNGLAVQGAYGKAWLIESNYVPSGYVAVVASGGPGSPNNPVAVRQHANVAYQGLRAIPGHWSGYPLLDSFFARGVGVGVRHRGAAAVVQVTTNASYTPPSSTLIPI